MTSRTDVVVVGGGPAGSVTSLLLARRGWSVVLLDRARFPRPKPCGECLNPGAVRVLTRLGLEPQTRALRPALLAGWRFTGGKAWRGVALAPFPEDLGPGWGIARTRLDAALLDAARVEGVRVREGCKVTRVEPAPPGGRPRVRIAQGPSLEPRLLVGADGLRSVVARSLEAYRQAPRILKASLSVHVRGVSRPTDRGELVLDPHGTLGLAPLDVDGNTWNLTLVVPRERSRELPRDAAGLVARARAVLPGLRRARAVTRPLGSGPFDRPVREPVAEGVLLVGDAAGYFDPLTGQGIFRALRSAELAAPVIDRALATGACTYAALTPYAREIRRAFRGGRRVQVLIEALLRRPRLLGTSLPFLARSGALSDLIAVTGDGRPPRSLLTPDLALRLVGALRAPLHAS